MEFHEKLQELRKQKNLTQEELSEILFVSRTAISKWESGRGYPSIDSLKAIAEFFGVTIDELLSNRELRVDLSRVNSAKCSKLINCYLSLFINNKGLPIDTAAPSACRETRFIVQSWTGFLAYNSQIRIM